MEKKPGLFVDKFIFPDWQNSRPSFIPFPEVEKLAQMKEAKKHGFKRFVVEHSLLSKVFGYLLSPSYSFLSLARKCEKRPLMDRLSHLLCTMAKFLRRHPTAEYFPIFLLFTILRFIIGIPVEWLIFCYYSSAVVLKLMVEKDEHTQVTIFTVFVTTSLYLLFWSAQENVRALADIGSGVFLATELASYHKIERIFYVGMAYSGMLGFVSTFAYPTRHVSLHVQSIASINAAAVLVFLGVNAFKLIFKHHISFSNSLFHFEAPGRFQISVSSMSESSCALSWTYEGASLFQVELNGHIIGSCEQPPITLRDLKPRQSYKVRFFAVVNGHWIPSNPIYIRTISEPIREKIIEAKTEILDQREIQVLTAELESLQEQRHDLEHQLDKMQEIQSKEEFELQEEIQKTKTIISNEQAQVEKQKQRSELKALEECRKELDLARLALQKDLETLKSSNNLTKEEIDQKREDIEGFKQERIRIDQEMKQGLEAFEAKQGQLKEDVKRLQGITEELSKANERRETNLKQIQKDCQARTGQLSQLVKQKDHVRLQMELLRKKRLEKTKRKRSIEEKRREMAEEVLFLKRQLKQVGLNKQKILNEIEVAEREIKHQRSLFNYSPFYRKIHVPSDESIDDLLDAVNIDRLNSECEQDTSYLGSRSLTLLNSAFNSSSQQTNSLTMTKTSFSRKPSPYINSFFSNTTPFDIFGGTSDLRPDAPEYTPKSKYGNKQNTD